MNFKSNTAMILLSAITLSACDNSNTDSVTTSDVMTISNSDEITNTQKKYTRAITTTAANTINSLLNGDFESWSADGPSDWTTIDTGIELQQNSALYKTGSNSAEITVNTGTQSSTDFRQAVDVEAGKTYSGSVWVYHTEGAMKARLYAGDYLDLYSDPNLVNQWQEVTFTYTAPANLSIEIGMRFYDEPGFDGSEAVYIDNFIFTDGTPVEPVESNTVLNGDFENWSADTPSDWTTIDTGIELLQNSVLYKTGSNSAEITVNTGTQSSTDFRQTVDVESGKTYSGSVWVYHTEGAMTARLYAGDYLDLYSDPELLNQWQEISFTYTASGNLSIEIGLRFYDMAGFDGSEAVYVDSFVFTDGSVIDPVDPVDPVDPPVDPVDPVDPPTDPVDVGSYYDSAAGKTGFELKTALYNIVNGHTAKTYTDLWSFMSTNSLDSYYENDNSILDMYSENPSASDSYSFTPTADQCGNYSGEGVCYNREHSFPKSWFNEGYPMYTDIHHLFPTDGYVNGRRSNHPFGEVGNATWISTNGSKLGDARTGLGYNGTVFEPIDEFKGDFARAYFYMATRYQNVIAGWENNGTGADAMLNGSSDVAFEPWVVAMLKVWHSNDPVSQKEIDRNTVAFDFQGNRNPFVDHPEYISEIWVD